MFDDLLQCVLECGQDDISLRIDVLISSIWTMREAPRPPLGTAANALQAKPYCGPQPTLRRALDGQVRVRPPVRSLATRGFVICDAELIDRDTPELDRAGDWMKCVRGECCPGRAYLTPVYTSVEYALEAVPARAERYAKRVLPAQHRTITRGEPLRFEICSLLVEDFLGRDYTSAPCGLPDALRDLRHGSGGELAWLEMHRQRETERIEGALLPGGFGALGNLFLFLSAGRCIRELHVAEEIRWDREETYGRMS
jgi:hypothetical protein